MKENKSVSPEITTADNSAAPAQNTETQGPVLGSLPVSGDILSNARVSIWAIELNKGQAPRLYADDVIHQLIGVDSSRSPEDLWNTWFSCVDISFRPLLFDAVEKMSAGHPLELQVSLNSPDGSVHMILITGEQNPRYTDGTRLEGTVQDITRVLHHEVSNPEEVHQYGVELMKSNLRAESLAYVSSQNPDEDRFIDFVANKIMGYFRCDQVIFFDKNGEKYLFNGPGIEAVPERLCAECSFERCRGDQKYGEDGTIVMDDCSLGYMGEKVHPECPVKSSIIQQVYANDQLVGWLNVNYLQDYHSFTEDEVEIMQTISTYFGLLLERIQHKREEEQKAAQELADSLARQDREIIEVLASEYSSVYYIDLNTDGLTPYTMNEETETTFGSVFRSGITYSEAYQLYVDQLVYPEDKAMMLKAGSLDNIRKELANKKTFITTYRNAENKYSEMKFVKVGGDYDEPVAVALGFADKDEQLREEQESKRYSEIANALSEKYDSIYYVNTDDNSYVHFHSGDDYASLMLPESGANFFEDARRSVTAICQPEERKLVLDFLDKSHLLKALKNGRATLSQYKIATPDDTGYYSLNVVRPNPEEPHVIIAVENITEEVIQREKELATRNQDFEIIEILASEYSSVYYIDLTTDGLSPYTMNEETETTFGSVFRSGIPYSEAFQLYVDKLVYPEDRAMMLTAGSLENIQKELANKKTFITTYRDAENKYSEMKFVKVGGDYDKPLAVALGFAEKDEQIRAEQAEEQARRMDFDIIEILASEYSSVYYIDLNTDGLNPYTMNEETETTFGSVFRSGITYSEAYQLYVDQLVYPEDKEMMLKVGSLENIRKELANKKTFITTYRNADNKYSEMKFVKVGGDYDEPDAVALGFAEKDEQIRAIQAAEQERQMNFDIIEILASEYSSVYYIDLTTDGLNPYTMNAETETTFGSVFRSGIPYSEAFHLYVDKFVYPEDKEMMLKAGSLENINKELAHKKTFITTYRNADNKYSEMKFVKVGGDYDEPLAVALGFAEKDEQIRAIQAAEQERQMNFDIIEILASEYSSVYYIDITTDGLNPYTMNEETETTFGSVFRSGITYSEAYQLYVDKLVYPEDKAMMLKAGSLENIQKELANKKTFLTTYRNADNKYSEMKFVKVGGDYDEPLAVALGFAEKDEQIRAEQAAEQERQMNFDIIEILASEYSSVYYVDLTTDDLNPYTMNEETETTFGSVFRSGITYSEAYRLYVDKLVYPEDKAMMLKAGSIGNIMKELRTKKTFLTTYRNAEGHYSEMKFVKVGNEDGAPTAVALGFADKDEELRAKQEEERVLQRNIDIIEILASEYTSVYYIDMTTDELDPYTMNEQTESQFGEIFRSGIKYSDAFKMYVEQFVDPADKAMMLKAGSVYNILDELSSKKTFITQYRNTDGEYCEMKFVKVGEEENPQAVALGFSSKDEEIRAAIAAKEKQDRDTAVISGLSDDFGCVVYTSFDDFSEVHYRFDPLFEKHIEGWSKITDFGERLDKLISTIMHPEDRKAFWEATRPEVVRAAIDKDGVYFVNFRTLIDGEETYYQAKFARDELHPETNVIAGFHNVDAETKREMEALDQARSANKAKTDFLFNMSHDIRTPMNAIMGFTNIAMKNMDNKELVVDSLNKTQLAGELLLSLINNILDMSRIESGRITLDENEGDVTRFFDTIEGTMQELAKQKNITLTFSTGEITDRYVYYDSNRFLRVIVNIITNAIKYTNDGGTVNVRVEQVGTKDGRGLYQFTVEDNGIGMSEEFQAHMFEEFTRENTATVSGIQGTGLGLSVCKSFVNAMGGSIECRSKQGEGTTFTITLPLKIRQDAEIEAAGGLSADYPDSPEVDFHGCRILLVEDNAMNSEIAEYILADEGAEVETADDGTVAVKMVQEKGPDYYDLILMDIQMPVMGGYEATRQIRKLYPDSNIPIIAVSANAFSEDRIASLHAGMNDHVAKPINIQELKAAMAKVYHRNK